MISYDLKGKTALVTGARVGHRLRHRAHAGEVRRDRRGEPSGR